MTAVLRRVLSVMKRLLRRTIRHAVCLLVILSMLLAPAIANAGGCGYSYYTPTYYPTYEHKTYNTFNRYVVFDFTPPVAVGYALPYVLPAIAAPYMPAGASLQPQAATASAGMSSCDTKVALLESKLAALEARLVSAGSPQPMSSVPATSPGAAPPNPVPAALPSAGASPKSVLMSRCATCHEAAVAKSKGKDHIFMNGGKVVMSDKDIGASMRMMNLGKMPPAPELKLSDAEFSSAVNELLNASAGTK